MSKRLKEAYKHVDSSKVYALEEAVKIIKSASKAKFDETVEVAINLGIDAKKSDQNVRGVVQLPHGTGKTYRVAVFAKGTKATEGTSSRG